MGLASALVGLAFAPARAAGDDVGKVYRRIVDAAIQRAVEEVSSTTVERVDHSTWASPWVVRSEHYAVYTTASWFVGNKIANDLEFMLAEFQRLLGTDFVPSSRFEIWIFPTLADYNAAGQNAAEHSSFYGSYYASQDPRRPVHTYFTPNLTQLGMWATHSALHQFVEQAFGRTPPTWISEGLAAYFAMFWDWEWGANNLELVKQQPRGWIPLRDLVNASPSDYMRGSEARLVQLGMLFKYLLHYRDETRLASERGGEQADAPFDEYLRAVVRGANTRNSAFAESFGNDLDAIEADFLECDFF